MSSFDMDRQSLLNSIHTHKDELTAINDGEAAYTYFSGYRITRLIRQGILMVKRKGGRGKRTVLTDEARVLLEADQ